MGTAGGYGAESEHSQQAHRTRGAEDRERADRHRHRHDDEQQIEPRVSDVLALLPRGDNTRLMT